LSFSSTTKLNHELFARFVYIEGDTMSFYYLLVIIVFWGVTSCNSPENKETQKTQDTPAQNTPVFLFDSIIHYSIAIEEDTLWGIERISDKTKEQRGLIEIVLHEKLDTLLDTTVLNHLPNLGFTKRHLTNEKTEVLRKVFTAQHMKAAEAPACVPIFRDILVFRLNSKTTGVMKLCFDCRTHTLDGELIATKYINQESWALLNKTLKK